MIMITDKGEEGGGNDLHTVLGQLSLLTVETGKLQQLILKIKIIK